MPEDRTAYVAGLLFRNEGSEVALIGKKHPAWQAGKLNGIGGKIEAGETPLMAMRREFLEEAGADIAAWRAFAVYRARKAEVHWFAAAGNYSLKTMTDEEVAWYRVENLPGLPIIPNLAWLVPLALDEGIAAAEIQADEEY